MLNVERLASGGVNLQSRICLAVSQALEAEKNKPTIALIYIDPLFQFSLCHKATERVAKATTETELMGMRMAAKMGVSSP